MISLTYCKDTSISKHQYYCNSFAPFAFQGILVLDIASICLHNYFNPSRHALYKLLTLVKTGFTPEVTQRKSGVECDWDLASPYVVRPCLHTQWSRILGLVRGGDKDLS